MWRGGDARARAVGRVWKGRRTVPAARWRVFLWWGSETVAGSPRPLCAPPCSVCPGLRITSIFTLGPQIGAGAAPERRRSRLTGPRMHASHMVRVTARMPSRLRDALARAAAARLVPIAAYVRESVLQQTADRWSIDRGRGRDGGQSTATVRGATPTGGAEMLKWECRDAD